MIQNQVFVCGDGLLAHPVSFLFHLGPDVTKGKLEETVLADKRLVVADCRTALAGEVAEWVGVALAAGKPVLLLCPGADTLTALQGKVGILPCVAVAALLVTAHKNPSELTDFRVHALHYSASPSDSASAEAPSKVAAQGKAPKGAGSAIECACIDFASLGSAFVDPAAADLFKIYVEKAMDYKYTGQVLDNTPPTGLKYFKSVFTSYRSFTYSVDGVSNTSAGTATFTWTVWGFLDQTQQSNSQYLVVEGRISVNAGNLHSNDECDRGFGNGTVMGTLTGPMNPLSFVPTSGDGSFTGTVSIPINYKSPTGGYSIWTYSNSVSNTVSSWSCKSISSGANLGAQWWMTAPCDGSNWSDKWQDAFTTWGHVNDFTGASSGSLDVNTISAWQTNNLLTGYQRIDGNFGWYGMRFWGSDCSPGVYWTVNSTYHHYYNVNPGFWVDLTPIYPS